MNLKRYILISLAAIIFLGFLPFIPPTSSHIKNSPPDTVVEVGDVVIVNYTLWVNTQRVDDQEGTVYVGDPGEVVPSEIFEMYPDIYLTPNKGFKNALLGMKAGETKNVLIPAAKGFTNENDPYYGEDLFYEIRLKEILFDASTLSVTSTTIYTSETSLPSVTSGFSFSIVLLFGLPIICILQKKLSKEVIQD